MIVNMCSGKMAYFLSCNLGTLLKAAEDAGFEGAVSALKSAWNDANWNDAMDYQLSLTVGTDQPNATTRIMDTRAYEKAFGKRFGHPSNLFTFNPFQYAACVLGTVSSALAYWDWYVKQERHYMQEWKQNNGFPVCDSPCCVRRVTYNVYTSRYSRWCTFHWQEDKSMDVELRGYKAVATYAETALRAAIAADAAATEIAVQAAVKVGVPVSDVRAAAAAAGETAEFAVQAAVKVGVPESDVRAAAAAAGETAVAAETAETTAETAVWNAVRAAVAAARCKFSGCENIVERKRDKNKKYIPDERSETGWCRTHNSFTGRGEAFPKAMDDSYQKLKKHQEENASKIAGALERVEQVQMEMYFWRWRIGVQRGMEEQVDTEDQRTRNAKRTYRLNELKKRLHQAKAVVQRYDIRCTFCDALSIERVDEFTGSLGPARCYLLKKWQVKNGKRSSLLPYCAGHVHRGNRAAGTCAGSGETTTWPRNESQKLEGKVSELKDEKGKAPVGTANAPIVLDGEEVESQRGNSASDGASPTRAGKRLRDADDQRDVATSGSKERKMCIHVFGKRFDNCKDCNPCECGNARKGMCAKCDPCPHDKLKYSCADCKAERDTRSVPAGDATGAAAQQP